MHLDYAFNRKEVSLSRLRIKYKLNSSGILDVLFIDCLRTQPQVTDTEEMYSEGLMLNDIREPFVEKKY